MTTSRRIDRIEGRVVPVRGDNIDTDRIIPARFLKAVTFAGLDEHLFEDDRQAIPGHPFANPIYRGAVILLAQANFGCGSSREHAPQALQRWGIRACVGESFSEIFQGNALALGLPCVRVSRDGIARLLQMVEAAPDTVMTLSLADLTLRAGGATCAITMPPTARGALLDGVWDATSLLLDRSEEVTAVADRLPYLRGFPGK